MVVSLEVSLYFLSKTPPPLPQLTFRVRAVRSASIQHIVHVAVRTVEQCADRCLTLDSHHCPYVVDNKWLKWKKRSLKWTPLHSHVNIRAVSCQRSVLIHTLIWITCSTISFSYEFRTFPSDIIHGFLNMLHLVAFLHHQNFIIQNTWQFRLLICVVSRDCDHFHITVNILKPFLCVLENVETLKWISLSCLIICSCLMVCSCSSGYCWQCRRGLDW